MISCQLRLVSACQLRMTTRSCRGILLPNGWCSTCCLPPTGQTTPKSSFRPDGLLARIETRLRPDKCFSYSCSGAGRR